MQSDLDEHTDAEEDPVLPTPEMCRKQWNRCCAGLDEEDGWVKNGDKLLSWLPLQHRKSIREGEKLVIGGKTRQKPVVDLEKLLMYTRTQWTKVYKSQ